MDPTVAEGEFAQMKGRGGEKRQGNEEKTKEQEREENSNGMK